MDRLGRSLQRFLAQDRDFGQRYANLVKPIRDPTKNFDIDISSYLDQFLGELCQSRTVSQEGESSVIFTQAAFLIQGSAFVYSRKVDYLYDLVIKMAREIVHKSLTDRNKNENAKGGVSTVRRKKYDTPFVMHEDMTTADSIDDVPTSQQASGNQALDQRNQFRRQRRRPLSLVVFDSEREDRLYDLEGGRGSTLAMDYDCGPASPLLMPEKPETVLFGRDIGAIDECSAKSDVEEDPTVPVAPVWRSSLAKCINEECIKNEQQQQQQHPTPSFIGIKRLYNPMEEGPGKDKPLVVRRKTRKRAFNDCGSSEGESVSSVIVPVASIWVKQSHYPHLLAKELKLQGKVIPGGERYLLETLKALKQMNKEKDKNKAVNEKRAEDSDDVDDGPDMPSDDLPGPEQEDKDLDLACSADINLYGEAEKAPPSSEDGLEKESYGKLVDSYLQEFHGLSQRQLSDSYKKVASWESRIRPLLDTEEERESFNIHSYRNRVLDHFSNAPSKQTLYFREICRGRQLWEVPRYFIATLELANNYNVELGTDGEMEEGMDTLHLTLLSRKQTFHELEELGDNHASLTNSPEPARNVKKRTRLR
ncbi:hypothetical protein MTO96_011939 [Rhipicephalus appendiculatus]